MGRRVSHKVFSRSFSGVYGRLVSVSYLSIYPRKHKFRSLMRHRPIIGLCLYFRDRLLVLVEDVDFR